MRITAGVPLVTTVDGLKEQLDRPADTETRLYWEQQLDRGDAILQPLEDVQGWNEERDTRIIPSFTHRLISETGGMFHVRVEDAPSREWPQIDLPAHLTSLAEMARELDRITRQMQTLMVANAELEARLKQYEGEP